VTQRCRILKSRAVEAICNNKVRYELKTLGRGSSRNENFVRLPFNYEFLQVKIKNKNFRPGHQSQLCE
jgi:hypothetical protein